MKLTEKCSYLLDFFIQNNFINHIKHNKETNHIFRELYQDVYNAYNNVMNLKKKDFYKMNIKKINNVNEISKPQLFNANSFPHKIRNHINNFSLYEISFFFSLNERNITVHFITEEIYPDIKTYKKYLDWITMWLQIISNYSDKKCSKNLIIYLYFTDLQKELPTSNVEILDQNNINTAFTSTCPVNSEIIVFRKEEWFKVLIHETFHNFALDFSDMNVNECHKKILSIFKVKSSVNLYESYTEFWAEIINGVFCSFLILKNKNNYKEFLKILEFILNFEKTHSYFQLVKILNFMGLKYKDLYDDSEPSISLRNTLYKEKTNVLSYFVIKLILLNNYQEFIGWCSKNNISLFHFKKTDKNLMEFCKFIENNYKSPSLLKGIENTDYFINKELQNKNSKNDYLLYNLRMSLFEMC